jgi:hypothetical protein
MGGDELLALMGQRPDAAPMRRFLAGLREEAVSRPNHAMAKVRYLFTHSGVVLVESTAGARVIALYLHRPGLVCEHGSPGELPFGFQFSWTRAEVATRMRQPDFVGFLGRYPLDAWVLNDCMLGAAYGETRQSAFLPLLPWRRIRTSKGRRVDGAHHGIG